MGLVCNVGLLPTALGSSFLDKGVRTGLTGTHLGQLMHKLHNIYHALVTCPWQAELLQRSYGRQI